MPATTSSDRTFFCFIFIMVCFECGRMSIGDHKQPTRGGRKQPTNRLVLAVCEVWRDKMLYDLEFKYKDMFLTAYHNFRSVERLP